MAAATESAAASPGGWCVLRLGNRHRGVDLEDAVHAMELPTTAIGILHGLIGLSHGPQECYQVTVFNAAVFVEGHAPSIGARVMNAGSLG